MSEDYSNDTPEWCDRCACTRGANGCAHRYGDSSSSSSDSKEPRKSVATQLVEIALEHYDLGVTPDRMAFAVPRVGPRLVRLLGNGSSASLKSELSMRYFEATERAAPGSALADALTTLTGYAERGERQELYLRAAETPEGVFIDLGDETGRAVLLAPTGWQLVEEPPVLFRRTELVGQLPTPERGGDIDELWEFLNVSELDRPLVLAELIAAFRPAIPHPILSVQGEQGSGKSTATKRLKALIDPSPIALSKPPSNPDQWITTASASYIVGLDNLSGIPAWLQDALCRAATGDADGRRKLYSDNELVVFRFHRTIIANGIEHGRLQSDLIDRLLSISFERITDSARRNERELEDRWQAAHPRLFGALLDLAARVLAETEHVHLDTLPRMADFAIIVAALDRVLGTSALDRYLESRERSAHDTIEDDEVLSALRAILETAGPDGITDTAKELLARINRWAEVSPSWRPGKGWPTTSERMTAILKRSAPVLRSAGWTVETLRDSHRKVTLWSLAIPSAPGQPLDLIDDLDLEPATPDYLTDPEQLDDLELDLTDSL